MRRMGKQPQIILPFYRPEKIPTCRLGGPQFASCRPQAGLFDGGRQSGINTRKRPLFFIESKKPPLPSPEVTAV